MSDPEVGALLSNLVDRQAIWDCLMRYARGLDRIDEALIRSAFWEDSHDSHGFVEGSVEEFLRKWLPIQPDRSATQRSLTNHTVVINGSAAVAETYFLSSAKMSDHDHVDLTAGRYLDRFEKREGEWRIKNRLCVLDWNCVADASQMVERLGGYHPPFRSSEDPSYRLGI